MTVRRKTLLIITIMFLGSVVESSEQRYRLIVETAFDAFVGINSQGEIVDWNGQAEVMFGWKRSEIAGKSLSVLIDFQQGANPQDVCEFLASAFNKSSKDRIETIARNREGREFSVEMAISAVHSGEFPLFAALIQDVTQRKKTEAEKEKARSAAGAASRAKEEFLANMSHEIRTP